jgi:hypothetical protein
VTAKRHYLDHDGVEDTAMMISTAQSFTSLNHVVKKVLTEIAQ